MGTGRRVGSEIRDLNKARAYGTLYGEVLSFLSGVPQGFGWNIDIVCIKISPASMMGTECQGTRIETRDQLRGYFSDPGKR